MGKVVLSGYIDIPENELEVVATALENHIELTRNEVGCLIFEVTQSNELPTRFIVYEEFTDKTAFENHQARVKASDWGRVTVNVKRTYRIEEQNV
ncbi:TPA: antibiotic biosynthesis monooxygenase [Vibrio alginolyticus]|nr:antibiotic biosynthesis monooxygenase [Vibrio alginolyticus]